MTGPAFGIRVTIDAEGSKQGAQTHVRSIEQIKASTPQATTTVNQLRDALRQMGLSEDLVQKSIQRTMGVQQQATATTTALARATTVAATSVGTATVGAAAGTNKLTNALQTLAFSATGLPGPLGRVSGILGSLAIGGPITIAVTAGIAAIAFAWSQFTSESRKAKDATDELKRSLLEAARVRSGQTGRENRATLEAQLVADTKAVELARAQRIEVGQTADAIRKRNETIEQLGELYNREAEAYVEGVEKKNAKDRERANELKRQTEAAKHTAEERRKAEEKVAKEAADLFDRQLAAILAADPIYQAQLRREEKRLTLFKEFQRIQGDIAIDPARFGGDLLLASLGASGTSGPYDPTNRAEIEKADAAYRHLTRTIAQDFQQAVLSTFANGSEAVQGFVQNLDRSVSSVLQMLARARELNLTFQLGKGFSGKGATGANLSAGLGLGSLAGNLTGSGVGGLVGGGAAGFAVGGPLGAIAGAVSGFVSGLLSSAAKARQLAEARKAFESNLDDLIASVHPRGQLGDALKALGDTFDTLARQAAAAHGVSLGGGSLAGFTTEELQKRIAALNAAIAEAPAFYAVALESQRGLYEELLRVRKATDEAAEAARRRLAVEAQQFQEDLTVRNLRAQGRDAEADAEAFRIQQQREFEAVVAKYGASQTEAEKATNAATIAALTYTQQIEREAFAKKQAEVAAQKVFDDTQTAAGIEARIQENLGKDKEAAAVRRATQVAKEIHDAKLLVDQGIITQQMFDNFVASFDAVTASIQAATAAAEADAAFRKQQTARSIDAETQGLFGNKAEADRINEDIRRDEERKRVQDLYDKDIITKKQFDDWTKAFAFSLLPKFEDVFGNTLGGRGATQALTAVSATVTDRTAWVLVDYAKQQVSFQSYLPRIYDRLGTGGAGGGGVTISPHFHFGSVADFTHAELMKLVDEIEDELNTRFGGRFIGSQRASGSVS